MTSTSWTHQVVLLEEPWWLQYLKLVAISQNTMQLWQRPKSGHIIVSYNHVRS